MMSPDGECRAGPTRSHPTCEPRRDPASPDAPAQEKVVMRELREIDTDNRHRTRRNTTTLDS